MQLCSAEFHAIENTVYKRGNGRVERTRITMKL